MRPLALVAVAAAVAGALTADVEGRASVATKLGITFWAHGRGTEARSWTLRCRPVDGSLPKPGVACRALAALRDPFKPVPRKAICTQIYGGPAEGLVRGSHRGRRVYAFFRLRNGCQIARWKRVRFLFPTLLFGNRG
jgi:Subtilisin inhibitor-like